MCRTLNQNAQSLRTAEPSLCKLRLSALRTKLNSNGLGHAGGWVRRASRHYEQPNDCINLWVELVKYIDWSMHSAAIRYITLEFSINLWWLWALPWATGILFSTDRHRFLYWLATIQTSCGNRWTHFELDSYSTHPQTDLWYMGSGVGYVQFMDRIALKVQIIIFTENSLRECGSMRAPSHSPSRPTLFQMCTACVRQNADTAPSHSSLFRKIILRTIRQINLQTFHVWKMFAVNLSGTRLVCRNGAKCLHSAMSSEGMGQEWSLDGMLAFDSYIVLLNYGDTETHLSRQTHVWPTPILDPPHRLSTIEHCIRSPSTLFCSHFFSLTFRPGMNWIDWRSGIACSAIGTERWKQ